MENSTNSFDSQSVANPFAPNPFTGAPALGRDEGENYGYALMATTPGASTDDLDLPHVDSVEVLVLWGSNVLHVSHLTPPRAFYIGEPGKGAHTDVFIPSEVLGAARLPLLLVHQGSVAVVFPEPATGYVEAGPGRRLDLGEARSQADAGIGTHAGHEFSLRRGMRAVVSIGDFVFQVSAASAGKPVPRGFGAQTDWNAAMYFGLTFLAAGGFLTALAFFVPRLRVTDEEDATKDQLYLMQQFLKAAAEREQLELQTQAEAGGQKEGESADGARGEEGASGVPTAPNAAKRVAVEGPKENPDPHLARQALLREATEFGVIGLLSAGVAGDPNAPTAPWGRDTSLGVDEKSARGGMFGDEIDDVFGDGGLGLSGSGVGGGRYGEGIGMGGIRTALGGLGREGEGCCGGRAGLGASHKTRVPQVRPSTTTVTGRLPPQVIQRIVRQNFGRFRNCYEQGLARNPNLEGRVAVRFVVDRQGAVANVANGGSDLPDSAVVGCVIAAFYGLSFPAPEDGIVSVVYPILLSPG